MLLTQWLIGAGGWAYFHVPKLNPLKAYSRAFNFVEVNSTFYEYPNVKQVEMWRKRVPPHFQFAVRCHQDLTHRYELEPREESHKTLHKMLTICRILRANILHLQTPPSIKVNETKIDSMSALFERWDLKGVRIAWEIRQTRRRALNRNVIDFMQANNFIHCVDVSREDPAFESDILYTRLFGKGVHNRYQFTDNELKEVERKTLERGTYDVAAFSFHSIKMYTDAARFQSYHDTRSFLPVTRAIGLDSLKEVLEEDSRFPYTKQRLLSHQGWKIIDWSSERRVRAASILEKLPEKVYYSLDDVIQTLKVQMNDRFG